MNKITLSATWIPLFFTIFVFLLSESTIIYADYGENDTYLGQFVDDYLNDDFVNITINTIHNSTLNCMELNYSSDLVYENFTTWLEDDPLNKLSQTVVRSTWTNLTRGDIESTLYDDKGVDGIGISFEYLFKLNLIDIEAGDADERYLLSALYVSNTVGADEPASIPRFCIYVTEDLADDNEYTLYLMMRTVGFVEFDKSALLSVGVEYYCNLTRYNDGKSLDLTIRTDSHNGSVIDVVTIFNNGFIDTFRYLKIPHKEDHPTDEDDESSGYVEYLSNGTIVGYSEGFYYTEELLEGDRMLNLLYNVSIDTDTGLTIEFSEDNNTWVNHNNVTSHEILVNGFESIDLRDINGTTLYVRLNMTTIDSIKTPYVYQLRLIKIIGTVEVGKGGINSSSFILTIFLIIVACALIYGVKK